MAGPGEGRRKNPEDIASDIMNQSDENLDDLLRHGTGEIDGSHEDFEQDLDDDDLGLDDLDFDNSGDF